MLQKVVRSTVIDAPIERVWAVLRDFNSHDQWHDVVAESRIEGGEKSDQVGCVRAFHLKDGNFIREQLLTLDEREHKSTYCIVEATVPLMRYVATVTLKPVTDGNRTFWHWESTFATPPGQERELRNMVARLVLFPEAVDERLGQRRSAPPPSAPEATAAPGLEAALLDLPLPAARELVMEQFERRYVEERLQRHAGNVSRAAEGMGVSRQLLHRLIERYGLRAK